MHEGAHSIFFFKYVIPRGEILSSQHCNNSFSDAVRHMLAWRVASMHGLRKAAVAVLKPRLVCHRFQSGYLPLINTFKICAPRTFCSAALNHDAPSPEAAEENHNRDYAYYIKILQHTAKHRLHDEAFQILDYMRTDEGLFYCYYYCFLI